MFGLVGKKLGMTRLFHKEGYSIPVTVIEVVENRITQIKHQNLKKFCMIQVTTGIKKFHTLNKPKLGHFKKNKVNSGRGLWEFKVFKKNNFKVGQSINVNFFNDIKKVDVTGFSKGKGFSGTIKRWNFSSQDASHGNSLSHRAPGSIGQNQTPGRVFKGKKMAGHLGNKKITVQSLIVIKVNVKKNYILIKGSVPGSLGGDLIIKPAIKNY
ncbi:MAG: 50S ribosomal protein L3 [Buchnera aphidicola (Periphyllus lyropictus)]|uniref:50S ribosomal protein L3 n=1 Tax=Buchnera aphidicola TaxID=9 RepID=UPI001ED248A0|nr:50S ribosomal protein L3 [Buchnera aphidicola]NIH16473.1 50S ribosomal protein L3 [Buchnera aphidicola (Periphyllus lyropictus)]USS94758.1 50S ribosomal protein L3 [Buchnera aphidicola (Periphyllus lyropictus)]